MFLINLTAGGIGLNLTEADHCFLLDPAAWSVMAIRSLVPSVRKTYEDC